MHTAGRAPPNPGPPVGRATLLLILVNVVVYVAMVASTGRPTGPTLAMLGAKVNGRIHAGEAWRLVTAGFLHASETHLVVNMLGLFVFGRFLEALVGPLRFVSIYLIACLCGAAAGYAFHDLLSVGSSGAVFGVLGALNAYLVVNRAQLPHIKGRDWAIVGGWVLFILLGGLAQTGVDNWAHGAGLAAGFGAGLTLVPRLCGVRPGGVRRNGGCAIVAGGLVACMLMGEQAMRRLTTAVEAEGRGDLARAQAAYEEALRWPASSQRALAGLARVLAARGELAGAHSILERCLERAPEDLTERYDLARLLFGMGRVREALVQMETVKRGLPAAEGIDGILAVMYLHAGEPGNALIAARRAREQAPRSDTHMYPMIEALGRLGARAAARPVKAAYEALLRRHAARVPFDPVAANNLAWWLFGEGRDLETALVLARRAVALAPANPYTLGTLGCLDLAGGRTGEALASLERAIARHATPMEASTDRYFAATAAARLGDGARATRHLMLAREVDPLSRHRRAAEVEVGRVPKEQYD